jgi:PBSX family phage terminase large subunit
MEKLNLQALKYPGMRGLIVRKTAASLSTSALVTWNRFVIPEARRAGLVTYYGGSPEEPPQYRYDNGSKIVIGGMDKASKIMSTEYDVIYVQEAVELTEDDWENLSTRKRYGRLPYQQLIADTNPSTPTHWLKARCDRGATTLLESRHEDNPLYYNDDGTRTPEGDAYIGGVLDNLTGVRHARLRKGLWVAAEGMIYEEFDPARHVIDPFEIPSDWTRYLAIDFGYTNPFVCQWWAEDPDGCLFMYREIYRTRRLVEQHSEDIRTFWDRPRQIICDHDAEGRATLELKLGQSTTKADKRVADGIQAVQARLKAERLHLFSSCVVFRDPELVDAHKPASTIEELPGYVWADSKTKEQPVKQDDHGADAMRYLVAARDLGGRSRVRFM